ncbi:MAG: acetyl-CoA carboxylase biotin carboxyl carrier protein subunit [Chloroflexota bacterium]
MQLSYSHNGEKITLRLDKQADGSYSAIINDETFHFQATQLRQGTWLIDLNGQRHTVHTAQEGDQRYAQVDGVQYQLEKASRRRRNNQSAGSGGDLTSEMPGQVIDVRVAEGDTVSSGDVLLVLEAMKMEIRITAPQDGTVTKLMVAQGDIVERGQTLAEVSEK